MTISPNLKAALQQVATRVRANRFESDTARSELATMLENIVAAEQPETVIGNVYPLAELMGIAMRLNRPIGARNERVELRERLNRVLDTVTASESEQQLAETVNRRVSEEVESRIDQAISTQREALDAEQRELTQKKRAVDQMQTSVNARMEAVIAREREAGQRDQELHRREYELNAREAQRNGEDFAISRENAARLVAMADDERTRRETAEARLSTLESGLENRINGAVSDLLANPVWRKEFVTAYRWEGMKGHPLYYQFLEKAAGIHHRKNQDYAGNGDPLQNLRESEQFGIPAWKACLIRISDKYSRIRTLTLKGEQNAQVVDESLDDTLFDLANYALLTLVLRAEDRRAAEAAAAEENQRPYGAVPEGWTDLGFIPGESIRLTMGPPLNSRVVSENGVTITINDDDDDNPEFAYSESTEYDYENDGYGIDEDDE